MPKITRIIGFALLWYLMLQADLDRLGEVLAGTRVTLFGAALLCSLGAIAIKAVRFKLLLRLQGYSYSLDAALKAYFAGVYLGLATPGRLGELVRVLYLRRDLGVNAGSGLAPVIFDRFLDLYALIAVSVAAGYRFGLGGELSGVFLLLLTLLAIAPLSLLHPGWRHRFTDRFLGRVIHRYFSDWLLGGEQDFYEGLRRFFSPGLVVEALLTALSFVLFFGAGVYLVEALGLSIAPVDVALMLGFARLFSFVPITVAGVGTRDAVFVFFFFLVGASFEAALAFSALSLATFYIFDGLVGLGVFLADRPPLQMERC